MLSRWDERAAAAMVARLGAQGVPADLAIRVYSTQLLGSDPKLVLHGGGNTSVKMRMPDLIGAEVDVLCVKGSGWDMATLGPAGLPAVRLEPLRKLRGREALSDEDMVRLQRANLLDPNAATPSVETLLHAFLPHKFVDHTHSTAVLSLIDQANADELCREVYGERLGLVPYVMPGFALAKLGADVFDAQPAVIGLILHKHGIFTVGADARESYERMIEMVTLAEDRIAKGARTFASIALPARPADVASVAPVIRGACALPDPHVAGDWRRFVLEHRNSDTVMRFVNGKDIERYALAGVATPDHTIRTKNWPLLLLAADAGALDAFKAAVQSTTAEYKDKYRAYFEHNNLRCGGIKSMLDPAPRVVLAPGIGLFGVGRSKKDAGIAADIAESAIDVITGAEAIGQFESISEADMFDVEYWSLEQAKLGKDAFKPLAGQVVLVTGAGGAIGSALARAFAEAGAEVALLDLDLASAQAAARKLGGIALACDVTDAAWVRAAFDAVCTSFGGVDIVVSNAGAAWQGRIGEVDDAILRKSFELNFFAHQTVAQNAVRIMRMQGTGGCLLFNVSKQAVNPGPDFGPYGLPKAATLALMRQYAIDYGAEGIRSNAVNADRIRSGLLTDEMIAARSKARGVTEKDYMGGNLLGHEVTADDVAQAFLAQALALKTTANVLTVDGGNIAAALR